MAAPAKINLKIYQGSTFKEQIKWESSEVIFKPITVVHNTAPLQLTVPDHGLIKDWKFTIYGVKGLPQEEYLVTSLPDADNIIIGNINGLPLPSYTSGGVVEYYAPIALTGLQARMQLREKVNSETFIDELTTQNGKIIISDADKTITILIDALDTAGYSFTTAVYSLELISGSVVTQLAAGNVTLVKEVTR